MEQTKLSILKIEIETFKKIRNLILEPEEGANLFFGSFRSGKTSLCEFIHFALFGADSVALARDNAEDANGSVLFALGDKKYLIRRSVIGGKEECSFTDDAGNEIESELTPGEFLTGLSEDAFDLITYFRQARYETPVCKPSFHLLKHIASFHEDTKNVYQDEQNLKARVLRYRSDDKKGSLDLLQQEKDSLSDELRERPHWEEELQKCTSTLDDIGEKLDENDRRRVLLKADMAGFSDDLKLSRNKENAQDLHKQILAKEKEFRIASFDVTHKIGLLSEAELEKLKNNYNRLSLAETALAEARTAYAAAEENLSFHRKLFSEWEDREHYEEEKERIDRNRLLRLIARILGVVLMGCGAFLFYLLYRLDYRLLTAAALSGAVILCGISAEFVSMVFTSGIHKILKENKKKSTEEFYDFFDKLCAHEKTTQVYKEKVLKAKETAEQKEREKEAILDQIRGKLRDLGHENDLEDPVSLCDNVIEANDALYDLQREINEEKEKYHALLASDVERESLEVSPEFAALQKELSFLSVQNDSLYKKRALVSENLLLAKEHLAKKTEDLEKELAGVREAIVKETREWESAELNFSVAKARRERFENALKEKLTLEINRKVSFVLNEGESFLFDHNFELCFCDRNSVLPLISAGGGMITEMGLLAFRLSLAELLGKNHLPMIFDDSFAMLSPDATLSLYEVLKETCSQFFIATSSAPLLESVKEGAAVFVL